ncbi:hypothetical protein PIB30_064875 [Stylosanthes scabra]|uniref:Uncharacterized protein n=1 Tax=Stylosanthes scabra TaxID=79078 RepID=A0ABU6QLT5_9FABA|nr:hypothetical protein [Stylosanthes scabra]
MKKGDHKSGEKTRRTDGESINTVYRFLELQTARCWQNCVGSKDHSPRRSAEVENHTTAPRLASCRAPPPPSSAAHLRRSCKPSRLDLGCETGNQQITKEPANQLETGWLDRTGTRPPPPFAVVDCVILAGHLILQVRDSRPSPTPTPRKPLRSHHGSRRHSLRCLFAVIAITGCSFIKTAFPELQGD